MGRGLWLRSRPGAGCWRGRTGSATGSSPRRGTWRGWAAASGVACRGTGHESMSCSPETPRLSCSTTPSSRRRQSVRGTPAGDVLHDAGSRLVGVRETSANLVDTTIRWWMKNLEGGRGWGKRTLGTRNRKSHNGNGGTGSRPTEVGDRQGLWGRLSSLPASRLGEWVCNSNLDDCIDCICKLYTTAGRFRLDPHRLPHLLVPSRRK